MPKGSTHRQAHPSDIPKGPLRDLARAAVSQGWRIHFRRNGHLVWYPPEALGERPIFTGITHSDHRSHKNLTTTLRHHGLEV